MALSNTIHDGLTGTRAALIDDAGSIIPEIPTDAFFEHVFPRPTILQHLEGIVATLSKSRGGAYSRPMRRWRAFPTDTKNVSKVESAVTFKSLMAIATAVANATGMFDSGKTATTRFDQDPTQAPASDWRTSDSKPDAYFILSKPHVPDEPHWMNIAATGEYKRSDGETRYLEDDSKKVVWNMHQVLRGDPCRRHTYGFTIESDTIRLWYASRAEILVAEAFDFMESPAYIVRFFLGLFYSDLPELGWDPTMEYHPAVGDLSPYYIITVRIKDAKGHFRDAQFKTIDLLSNVGVEALRGCGTRVWTVRRWVNGAETGDTMVLKDCWIDSDRPREGDIMAKIVEEADAVEATRANVAGSASSGVDTPMPEQRLKNALLTVHMHGDVYVGDTVDRTFSEGEREKIYDPNGWFIFHRTQARLALLEELGKVVDKTSSPSHDHPMLRAALRDDLRPITYHPKTHYRIIFEEVCKVLHQEDSLEVIFDVLTQVCLILKALHGLGWVHRDISVGNIMFIDSNKQVKLADFEYAKKIGTSEGSYDEIRVGTADFMSIEVNAMKYYFEPVPDINTMAPDIATLNVNTYNTDKRRQKVRVGNISQVKTQKVRTWCYNPLHELESVVWMFFYFTLFRDVFLVPKNSPPFNPVVDASETASHSTASAPLSPISNTSSDLAAALQETEEQRIARIDHQFQFAETLFISRTGRFALFVVRGDLEDHLVKYPLHPALVRATEQRPDFPISELLLVLRDMMLRAYANAEKNVHSLSLNPKEAAPDPVYTKLTAVLQAARDCVLQFRGWDVRVRPLSDEYYALRLAGKLQGVFKVPGAAKNREQERKSDAIEGTPTADATQPSTAAARAVKRGRKSTKKRTTTAMATEKRKRAAEEDVDTEAASNVPRKAARMCKEEGSIHDVVPARATRRSTRTAPAAPAVANKRTKVSAVNHTSLEPGGGGRTLRPRKPPQLAAEPAPSEPRQRVTRSRRK